MEKETQKHPQEEVIKEINFAIRDSLNKWSDIMLESEVDQWAYNLNYFPRDLMNAVYIFQHVASNIGIKAGLIDEEKAEEYGKRLRQLVVDMTGQDPALIAEVRNGND